jgi:3',5'-cyclic AMP phosphodiesterase CpdA
MASEFFINLSKIAPVHVIVGNHDANLANNQRLDALSPIISLI